MALKRKNNPMTPNGSKPSTARPGAPTKKSTRRTRRRIAQSSRRRLFPSREPSPRGVENWNMNGGKKHKINRKTRKARKSGKNKK